MEAATKEHSMASNRRELSLAAPADKVWDAVRDFHHVHQRVAPGFLTKLEADGNDRVLTFFNGLVARERLVATDEAQKRLVYPVVEGRPTHYNGSVEVLDEGPGKSRLVWTIDLLPDELGPSVASMMDAASAPMKKALEA
jgi:carbon monoxide dehydrogenase subunit G